MIKYNFLVEQAFRDKENNKQERKIGDIIENITEERVQKLNEAKVGRVINAIYIEEKATVQKNKKQENKKEIEKEIEKEINEQKDGTEEEVVKVEE